MHNLDEEDVFQMWFALNEERIRKLREQYERDNNCEIGLRDFAEWLRFTEDLSETLNQN
jgi:hypothetical protein